MPDKKIPEDMNKRAKTVADIATGKNNLTKKQAEVLEYLLQGLSNKEIAHKMNVSVQNIKLHMQGIFRKIGANNRTHAAIIVLTER